MGGYASIAAVGKSIERLLAQAFLERQPVPGRATKAVLIRTEDLSDALLASRIGTYALSILLYRVDFNRTMRSTWSAVGHGDGRGPREAQRRGNGHAGEHGAQEHQEEQRGDHGCGPARRKRLNRPRARSAMASDKMGSHIEYHHWGTPRPGEISS